MGDPLDDVLNLDALAQSALVRAGEVTPRALCEAAIARIERVNPAINAVTIRRYEQALGEASDLTAERLASAPTSGVGVRPAAPFAGVPLLLKDLGPTCAGSPATMGSAFLDGFVPPHDAEMIRRLRRAGLVILGKTNSAEFGALPTTEPAFGGPTHNPWRLGRSAGGSSGGSAAAVAARLVPIAHATDGGGSIRVPASCCGVFGLKPTRARVSLGPDVGDLMNGLVCAFGITRSVADSAALLDAVAGPSPGDPYPAPPISGTFLEATTLGAQGKARRLVIAVSTGGLSGESLRAVESTAALCQELGHRVVQEEPPVRMSQVSDLFLAVWAAGVSSAIGAYAAISGRQPKPDCFEEVTYWLYEEGQRLSASRYLMTISRLQQAARRLSAFYERCDVHLSAVTREPAPEHGVLASKAPGSLPAAPGPAECLARALDFIGDAPLMNLTGQPAMSMPTYRCADGVPLGTHFAGRFGDEASLFALAAELEMARPWSAFSPSL